MPATPFDSPVWRGLLGDPQAAQLFTDGAEARAVLLVWGALAEAQAALGRIPETAARAIARAAREAEVDPAALAEGTARDGTPLPALAEAFRAEIGAPEPRQWVAHEAPASHVEDTALALRLRQALNLAAERLDALGPPMAPARAGLDALRPAVVAVAPFEDAALRERLAADLRLGPTGGDGIAALADWAAVTSADRAGLDPGPHGLHAALAAQTAALAPAIRDGDRPTRRLLLPLAVLGTLAALRA